MSFPFKYRLGGDAVEVCLGPFVVRRIPYWDIESVRLGLAFFNEHWTNVWPLKNITIRRKSGLFKNFVINPMDREAFVEQLKRRLGR